MEHTQHTHPDNRKATYRLWSAILALLFSIITWLTLASSALSALADLAPGPHRAEGLETKNRIVLTFMVASILSFVISLVLGIRTFRSGSKISRIIASPGLLSNLAYIGIWVYFLVANLK